jgi:hypothetical protein
MKSNALGEKSDLTAEENLAWQNKLLDSQKKGVVAARIFFSYIQYSLTTLRESLSSRSATNFEWRSRSIYASYCTSSLTGRFAEA